MANSEPPVSETLTLTLTAEQARVLVSALDAYTRIGLGQFENVVEVYGHYELGFEVRDRVTSYLKKAKIAAGHPSNGSYGIRNVAVPDKFRVAYDIQQVVRHRLAWNRNPKGAITVDFDPPWQVSEQALPTIK